MNFVIIEQDEDGEAYITHVEGKDMDDALDNYDSVASGNMVILNEQAYYNMIQAGVGA